MRKLLGILLIVLLIVLAVAIPVAMILEPEIIQDIRAYLQEIGLIEGRPPVQELEGDAQRYFELRNISCGALSKNFLIVTEDVAEASMEGLIENIPNEQLAAERILDSYSFNQTTKTYVREDQMKHVVIADGIENTTIWKEGRIYECRESCAMQLMDAIESEEYYANISKMKTNCAYFGKTQLPDSVDINSLVVIVHTGTREMNSYRCDNFLISGNKTYAASILETEELDEEQRALMWALVHLEGPVQECLDESTGIIVLRDITLDLTDAYRFDYSPAGYMRVSQQTRLLYFTDEVPQEFLALPG